MKREDVEKLIGENTRIELTAEELKVFKEELKPHLDAWEEDYSEIPAELLLAYLNGFTASLAVVRRTGN